MGYSKSSPIFQSIKKPLIIAGPCSAETSEQVNSIAQSLSQMAIPIMRAGVWKPRTRPGYFEGKGEEALEWLQEAQKKYGIKIAIEVAETEHIEMALKYGIEVLWLGARTTVNPFQVQRLADSLKGMKITVMVKNPINPDVDLWLGAIERLEKNGITDIAAIHRGFSSYKIHAPYRNSPNWAIPIELRRRRGDLPIICDPSHIAGNKIWVNEVAQKSMDMGFDGLMIETHPNPSDALSDATQQLTPEELKELIHHLIIRKIDDKNQAIDLEYLRQVMDTVDAEIIDLLVKRMELSTEIGRVKKEKNLSAFQPDRWREIIETRTAQAVQRNLPDGFILKLMEIIHDQSIQNQLEILKDEPLKTINNNLNKT